ncbi:MAG: cytochrome c [Dehalococcoidia bacterium]
MRRDRPSLAGIAVASVLALSAVACGPAKVTAVTTSADGAPLDGRGLYAANCARCHGAELQGTATGPPFLNVIYQPGHHSDASFLVAVRSGVQPHHWNFGPMAPIEGLSEQQVASIVAFVRGEQRAAGIR